MTQYKIQVKMPDIPKGEPVEFAHLGQFENGGTYDLPEENVLRWQQNVIVDAVQGANEKGIKPKIEDAMFPEGVKVVASTGTKDAPADEKSEA